MTTTLPIAMMAIAATIAYPCLFEPTILPNVRGRLNEITSSRKIWIQFVHVRRVLERVRAVRVVEAATVRAEFLDGFLARDRTTGDVLGRARERVHVGGVEVLDHAGADDDHDRGDRSDRQQDPHRDPDQVDPEIAQTWVRPCGRSRGRPR